MEKNNIFENNEKDEKYYELEKLVNEMLEADANINVEKELSFASESDKKENIYMNIDNSRNSEERQYHYDNYEYTLEDTWDAMTDGMYGDMPEGWDGDLVFLGY